MGRNLKDLLLSINSEEFNVGYIFCLFSVNAGEVQMPRPWFQMRIWSWKLGSEYTASRNKSFDSELLPQPAQLSTIWGTDLSILWVFTLLGIRHLLLSRHICIDYECADCSQKRKECSVLTVRKLSFYLFFYTWITHRINLK